MFCFVDLNSGANRPVSLTPVSPFINRYGWPRSHSGSTPADTAGSTKAAPPSDAVDFWYASLETPGIEIEPRLIWGDSTSPGHVTLFPSSSVPVTFKKLVPS